ncbi:MAG TPA: heme ABC exporter ATP-binding protein CcmA [Ktedonobacteraceae bacterium]|jgi:heme ABC exporter ATP-binding subunit CcmA|nr:heme ABC exporter ATP-binding protein CcmA [Ktedonobacteraceae bacterium]
MSERFKTLPIPEQQPTQAQQQPDALPVLLSLKGVKKSFGLKPVLRKVDLVLHRSERLALLGANGAGKTTLLRMLACLTQPDSGTIALSGLESRRDAQQFRQLVGLVTHDPFLYEELTALENLLFFGRLYAVPDVRERARELLRCVGLERRMQDRVGTFSRGMLQRLAWARALLHRPRLLLLDEPETGLDQDGHALMISLLAEHIAQGGSCIFTTHQLEWALESSERLAILHSGRIVFRQETAQTSLEELRRTYQEVVR